MDRPNGNRRGALAALAVASLCLSALAAGCKEEDVGPKTPAPVPGAATAPAGSQPGAEARYRLGERPIGGRTVSVTQVGRVEDDGRVGFEIAVKGGEAEAGAGGAGAEPKAVRAWLGVEKEVDQSAHVKQATKQGDVYVVELSRGDSASLVPGVKLLVELETEAGAESAEFDLEK